MTVTPSFLSKSFSLKSQLPSLMPSAKLIMLLVCMMMLSIVKLKANARDSVYLFSYFMGNGEDGLHLAYSEDSFTWNSLKDNGSFLVPELSPDKLMRDPCIIRDDQGTFHMVWTVSWTQKGIGYASSKDLIHWSPQQYIPVMEHEPLTRNTWAPEITFDAHNREFLIYWSSTITDKFPETQIADDNGYNHRIYSTKTRDFNKFSPTTLLYDPGFNVIDASIIPYQGSWLMFLKDETKVPAQKNLKIASADKLEGPYTSASAAITGDYWAEGPTILYEKGLFTVYFDKYMEQKYGAIQSRDLKQWTDISDQVHLPQGMRHGTIFKIARAEFDTLKAAL